MFDIVWLGRRVALRASNGKYVCTKKNGQLSAVSDSVGEYIVEATLTQNQILSKKANNRVCRFIFPSRRGRAADSEADQQAYSDPEGRKRLCLPPQELKHTGRQSLGL